MAKGFTIKLIYDDERTASPKIRKLSLSEGESPTLRHLRKSFSLSSSKALFYYDEDGDQITICNDRELESAIREQKLSDTLRLYTSVEEKDDVPRVVSDLDESGFPHGTCSNCKGKFGGGFLYKCVICSNVELCGRCEAFGVHSAHDIIRLTNNKSYSPQFFIRLQRLYDKMNHTQSLVSLHPLSSPPPPRPLGCIPSFSSESTSTTAPDLDLITADSAPLTVRQLSRSNESLSPKEKSLPPEDIEPSGHNTYRGVLQAPVTVLLRDEFQVHEAREANSEEIAGSLTGLRNEIDKLLTNEDSELKDVQESCRPALLSKGDSQGNESNCPYDLIKVISFEEENPLTNLGPDETKESTEQEEDVKSTCSRLNDSPSSSSSASKMLNDYLPTYSSRTRRLLNESSLHSRKYNQSPYLTTTQKVSDSLEQMKAMGFTDDDGWLTQVLTMERGNIEKVLDILTPVNK